MITRCKARVWSKTEVKDHKGEVVGESVNIGSPPYDPNPESENGRFFQATPSISMNLGVVNLAASAALEVGKDYYVDFIPVNTD